MSYRAIDQELDRDEIVRLLRMKVEMAGSCRQYGHDHWLSGSYVQHVLEGKELPGPSILRALGYEKVVYYRKVKSNGS